MYEDFYKLQARPFQLMPDPRRLFETASHTRGLSYLIYGLERGEGFVVVTGPVGTGKTLLLQVLLEQIKTRHLLVARVAMANVDADNVVATVAAAFGVPVRGLAKYEMLDNLVGKLSAARNRRALLIVDEAQTCSTAALEELRIVSNLQARGQALVQVVLVGQSELRDLLMRPAMSHLRQRVVASYHLEPLAADEVPGYIEHRLNTVGWRADRLSFGPGVYDRVYEWSGGIPRRINQIMDRLLLLGYLEEKRELTRSDLDTAIDEFQAEFASDGLVYDGAPGEALQSDAPPTSPQLDPLLERVAAVERALRAAYGEERVAELMRHHETSAAHRELVDAILRVERLEATMQDLVPETATAPEPVAQTTAAHTEWPENDRRTLPPAAPGSAAYKLRRLFNRE
ncbi:ExeA family protein [Salinisphaera hydrothermalis]|uniref:Putative secretion ATPase, PEP-CTERM locus subfamily protein n=1 Tax=Salinisphaera hydrothermalis (strain C41B8) TaxID=1304275 RepID=A0A084IMC3_SALHC|nr:AAA family ATPase [Salinisphaera hydrothermalis]KEZ77857.1 putative secretion ATPase, PEP-CTERM locus subfamily protein [Salinisphaera hydrothermalis C41B8]